MILLLALGCSPDVAPVLDTAVDPDVPGVRLRRIDSEVYAEPHFIGERLVTLLPERGLVVTYDLDDYRAATTVAVSSHPGARSRVVDGVGLWLSGDAREGLAATVLEPDTLETLRVGAGGVDVVVYDGMTLTSYPGRYPDSVGRLERVNIDGSVSVVRDRLCNGVGFGCGDQIVVLNDALWWTDAAGGLYSDSGTWHLDDGAIAQDAPVYSADDPPQDGRTRLEVTQDGRLWVGSVAECGAFYAPRTGASEGYGPDVGCGFVAAEGRSAVGSRVRVVTLTDPSVGALRVEWLGGDNEGEVQVYDLPDAAECWPIVAIGPRGTLAVTCEGSGGLYVGQLTG